MAKRSFKLTPQRRALLDTMLQREGVPDPASPAGPMAGTPAAVEPAPARAAAVQRPARVMDFGIMFFSSVDPQAGGDKYQLVLKAARFADTHDFACIWTPERHFHGFGGLFPNPAVTSAALAMVTQTLQLRAGSVISPLHHTFRIAEEWSVVDNLSSGRVGVSFGAGWNADDFLFFPDRFATRHAVMFEQIEMVQRLWRGESVTQVNTFGKEVSVRLYPTPVQEELPIWVTSSNSTENFVRAGAMGANVLTHLIGQDIQTLAGKIKLYRESLTRHNFAPDHGKVSLMLHTFIGPDLETVRSTVRAPFREYLRSAISLEEKAAIGGGTISGGHKIDPHNIPGDVMEDLLDLTFERYFETAALMGTPESCRPLVQALVGIGVDEIACLLDFGVTESAIMDSLESLNRLREEWL